MRAGLLLLVVVREVGPGGAVLGGGRRLRDPRVGGVRPAGGQAVPGAAEPARSGTCRVQKELGSQDSNFLCTIYHEKALITSNTTTVELETLQMFKYFA